jgi:hypothetical protein
LFAFLSQLPCQGQLCPDSYPGQRDWNEPLEVQVLLWAGVGSLTALQTSGFSSSPWSFGSAQPLRLHTASPRLHSLATPGLSLTAHSLGFLDPLAT